MSYVIHLWEHEAPVSMAEALQLHERLLASSGPPPVARFAALLERLVMRFPADVGGVDADGPTWVEPAPPRVDTDGVVLSLALYGDGPAQLLPALIEEADALGPRCSTIRPAAFTCLAVGSWTCRARPPAWYPRQLR